MKRPRQTDDESVLHEIAKASDAFRKKYKLLREQKHAKKRRLTICGNPSLKTWVEKKKKRRI